MKKDACTDAKIGTSTAAQLLGLCEASVRRLVATGDLPCEFSSKGYRLFRMEDIVAERARRAA